MYPGFRFNLSRQYVWKTLQKDDCTMSLYAGPGVTLGYVRDHNKGVWFDFTSLFKENPGFVAALSGDVGCRFDFGGRVALDLSFATDAGLHIRRNEKEQKYMATSLSIYNNGLIQSFYPQLTILFKLK